MFYPVHHHSHFLQILIKNSHELNLNHFLLFGKSKKNWKTCLLVVPVGFDPRFYITQGHYILTIPEKWTMIGSLFYFRKKKTCRNIVRFKNHLKLHVNKICKTIQYTIGQKNDNAHVWINKSG